MAEIPKEVIKALKSIDAMASRKMDSSSVSQIIYSFEYTNIFIDMYNEAFEKGYNAGYEAGVKKLDSKDFN